MTFEPAGGTIRNQRKSRSPLLYLVVILGVLCLSLASVLAVILFRSVSTDREKPTAPMHQITIDVEGEETEFGTGLGDITSTPMTFAQLVVTSSSKKRYSGSIELPYTMKFNESSGSTILVAATGQGSFDKPASISCKISIDGIPLASQRAELTVTSAQERSGIARCQATVP